MLIPVSSDAPTYHRPISTIGLIAANVVVFALTAGANKASLVALVLQYDTGLHPLQWITSNFLHAHIVHLVGNMVFLWAFGVIVEGKIGWWKTLLVYLAIGFLQCGLEQILSNIFHWEGRSIGASAVIFGMLAIAMVWAPVNEIHCVWLWRFSLSEVDIAVVWFAIMDIGFELLTAAIYRFRIGSELLHLMGVGFGFIVGVVLLKTGVADCEDWDLFSVMKGRRGRDNGKNRLVQEKRNTKEKSKPKKPKLSADERSEAALAKVRKLIEEGDPTAALDVLERTRKVIPSWKLPERELIALIKQLEESKLVAESVSLMTEYVSRFPEKGGRIRLRLAQHLLDQQRPVKALRILRAIPEGTLTEPLAKLQTRLARTAEAMREEGVLEIDDGT